MSAGAMDTGAGQAMPPSRLNGFHRGPLVTPWRSTPSSGPRSPRARGVSWSRVSPAGRSSRGGGGGGRRPRHGSWGSKPRTTRRRHRSLWDTWRLSGCRWTGLRPVGCTSQLPPRVGSEGQQQGHRRGGGGGQGIRVEGRCIGLIAFIAFMECPHREFLSSTWGRGRGREAGRLACLPLGGIEPRGPPAS